MTDDKLPLDPRPWHCYSEVTGNDLRYRTRLGSYTTFNPRPGYSQNEEDYQ